MLLLAAQRFACAIQQLDMSRTIAEQLQSRRGRAARHHLTEPAIEAFFPADPETAEVLRRGWKNPSPAVMERGFDEAYRLTATSASPRRSTPRTGRAFHD